MCDGERDDELIGELLAHRSILMEGSYSYTLPKGEKDD